MSDGRCTWSEADDAWLRKFNAEGKSDALIGEIMQRTKCAVFRRRKKLKLKSVGKAGAPKRFTMPESARESIRQANRARWADPAYRESHLPNMYAALAKSHERRFRRPPEGTPEFKTYRKLCKLLGTPTARQEMGLA